MAKMLTLVRREFLVERPQARAWSHLAEVERWPSWARHIRSVELDPPGALTARSRGRLRLSNGIRSEFAMTEYEPPHRWTWCGPFLWLRVEYEHRFEAEGERTRLIWIVRASGFGVTVLGRLFARIYERNLDVAIPRLVAEMNAGDAQGS